MMNTMNRSFSSQMMSHGASARRAEASCCARAASFNSIALIMDATIIVASIIICGLISVVSILALVISRLVVVLVVVVLPVFVHTHMPRMRTPV